MACKADRQRHPARHLPPLLQGVGPEARRGVFRQCDACRHRGRDSVLGLRLQGGAIDSDASQ
jgi:hypothetical protein